MFYQSQFWWMMPLTLLIVLIWIFISYRFLPKYRKLSRFILFVLGIYFLTAKIIDYIDMNRYPIEFSSITYFVFGLALILPFKRFRSVASLAAFLAGFTFELVLMLVPDMQLADFSYRYTLFRIINHNLLFFGGLLSIATNKIKWKDYFLFLLYIFVVLIYSLAMMNLTGDKGDDILIQVIDGSIVHMIFPNFEITWWWYCIWYPALLLLVLLYFVILKLISYRACISYRKKTLNIE